MRNISLLLVASLLTSVLLAQTIEMSDAELKIKSDSILQEANLLYKYERVAWISSDLAMENKEIKRNFGGYFIYEDQGEIKAIILGKTSDVCIAEYAYESDFSKPKWAKTETRGLSEKEISLIEVREKITDKLSNKEYDITIPDGYNPNIILIPYGEKYKLYFIMGTTEQNVIPFGNDYLLIADQEGKIESWQKFHSRIIPGYTEIEGNKVIELTHSHLRTTPLITATDICTFKLYAPLYEIDSFSVYSPALGKYMKYSLKSDEITVEE